MQLPQWTAIHCVSCGAFIGRFLLSNEAPHSDAHGVTCKDCLFLFKFEVIWVLQAVGFDMDTIRHSLLETLASLNAAQYPYRYWHE